MLLPCNKQAVPSAQASQHADALVPAQKTSPKRIVQSSAVRCEHTKLHEERRRDGRDCTKHSMRTAEVQIFRVLDRASRSRQGGQQTTVCLKIALNLSQQPATKKRWKAEAKEVVKGPPLHRQRWRNN